MKLNLEGTIIQIQKIFTIFLIQTVIVTSLGGGIFALTPSIARAAVPDVFDPGNIIDYTSFVSIDTMSVADIQAFLVAKGSGLAAYTEGGRTAAQIIWDASHGYGDASGTINGITINTTTGTVNPRVILVTLQKEQSLITTAVPTQAALNTAMGYGCPDSGGCNATYKGFTKQVEWAAWQFRYNTERANGLASDYQVGQTMTFANTLSPYSPPPTQAVTIKTAPTAGLYRYTPHVYNGNYNFWKFYRQWFASWQGEIVSKTSDKTLGNTESALFEVKVKNTGDSVWQQGAVNLGTAKSFDRISPFMHEDQVGHNPSGWLSDNRIAFQEASVAPGQIATFGFYYTVPATMAAGTYAEAFNVVAEGFTWFDSLDISWTIRVVSLAEAYQAQLINKSNNPTVVAGDSTGFEVSFLNTGYVTWKQGTFNLGTDRLQDRVPRFIRDDQTNHNPSGWVAANRIQLLQPLVAPGSVGTFRFYYTAPGTLPAGTYREHFRPVAEGVKWMGDATFDMSWDIRVTPQAEGVYGTQWLSQTSHPILKPGESHKFTVQFTNTSNATWRQDVVKLGTDRNQDRIPRFIREDLPGLNPSGWLGPNRIQMQETTVPPGSTATFTFWYTIPADMPPGVYRESFRPVADGIIWMRDWGVYWDITVTG